MTFRRTVRGPQALHSTYAIIDHHRLGALATAGGAVDGETVRGSDLRLWDDDDVITEAALVRDTSTQRPRRSSTAA